MIAALRYDVGARDALLNASGKYVPAHPVDQQVAFALSHRRGSIRSNPESGIDLSQVRLGSASVGEDIRAAVNTALASLLERGDVEVMRLEWEVYTPGQIRIAVTYRNLRTGAVDKIGYPSSV